MSAHRRGTSIVVVLAATTVFAQQPDRPPQQTLDPAGKPPASQVPRVDQPAPPVFRASTTLVQIAVVVVDENGQPVRGLTKDDFTIVDAGSKRAIAALQEFSRGDDFSLPVFPPSFKLDVADNAAARFDRVVVMVLDDLHGFQGRDDRVKELARQVVNDLGPGASMALLTTSGKQRAELTDNRSKVLATIDLYAGGRRQRKPISPVDGSLPKLTAARDADGTEAPPPLGAPIAERGSNGSAPAGPGMLGDYFGNLTAYKSLEDAARILAAEEGRRKAFVYVSEGTTMGPPPAMMEALRRAGVAVYSIDPRGNVPQASATLFRECSGDCACMGGSELNCEPFNAHTWVDTAQDSLTSLARQTGGVSVVNTDDFGAGLKRVVDDIENYYVLGFTPLDAKSKELHALVVQTSRSGLTLRYPRAYQLGQEPQRPNANSLVSLSAGALPKSELPLKVYAAPLPAGRDGARVAFWLEVRGDAQAMADADGALRDTLQYAVIPIDTAHGKALTGLSKVARVVLRPKSKATADWPQRVVYQVDATLPSKPGTYQFRLSASSTRLRQSGSVYLTVDVPDFGRVPLALGGLILGYDGRPRVPVADTAAANAKLPFQATLDRVFSQADALRLIADISKSSASAIVTATVELLNEAGATVRSDQPSTLAPGFARIDVTMPLKDLPPGAYRLRVRVSDGKNVANQETAIIVKEGIGRSGDGRSGHRSGSRAIARFLGPMTRSPIAR